MTTRTITIDPHHPDCRYPRKSFDPERCCYCAALLRGEHNPLFFRYGGGGGCACGES